MAGMRSAPSTRWFPDAFGFEEAQMLGKFKDSFGLERRKRQYEDTRSNFQWRPGADGLFGELRSKANSRRFRVGSFETPALRELQMRLDAGRLEAPDGYWRAGELAFRNIVGESGTLHRDPANAGAVFQIATLFNCLICPPGKEPLDGVTRYSAEATQGPACCVACPGALVFRNYFVNGAGQGEDEVDCLKGVAQLVKNDEKGYWAMRGGYCLSKGDGSIGRLGEWIAADKSSPSRADRVRGEVQVGIHWDTEVHDTEHGVCQVLCSALPVSMNKRSEDAARMECFARQLLIAAYDATLSAAAVLATQRGERVRVFLTCLGGGTLGNRRRWIVEALEESLSKHKCEPLDVMLVHYATLDGENEFRLLEQGRQRVKAGFAETQGSSNVGQPQAQSCSPKGVAETLEEMSKEVSITGSVPLDGRNAAYQRFDSNADGMLDSGELADVEAFTQSSMAEVIKAFEKADRNGDGVLDRFEFQRFLGQADPDVFTPKNVEILMKEADADADGLVHYLEFFAWLFAEDSSVVTSLMS